MRGVDSALQFAVSYHNFVYFFLSSIHVESWYYSWIGSIWDFYKLFGGEWGEFDIIFFFAQFGLHVLQLVALTTAHGFLVGIDSYTLPTITHEASLDLITFFCYLWLYCQKALVDVVWYKEWIWTFFQLRDEEKEMIMNNNLSASKRRHGWWSIRLNPGPYMLDFKS